MQLFQSELHVIEAAESLAASLPDDPNHTVTAAAMDINGNIYSGVNVYHFTGGPCAEVVVLGAAAAANAELLISMAAFSKDRQMVIPPCGRCRQVLLDHQPDISVAVPGEAGMEMISIRDLLPNYFQHPDARLNRFVRFDNRYYNDIRSGVKTSTTRWNDPITLGHKRFVFEDHPDHVNLNGEVVHVERFELATLTAEQACVETGTDMQEFRHGLRQRYINMPADAEVDVVQFRVTE